MPNSSIFFKSIQFLKIIWDHFFWKTMLILEIKDLKYLQVAEKLI